MEDAEIVVKDTKWRLDQLEALLAAVESQVETESLAVTVLQGEYEKLAIADNTLEGRLVGDAAPQTDAEWLALIFGDQLGAAAFMDYLSEAGGLARDLGMYWDRVADCEHRLGRPPLHELAAKMVSWAGHDASLLKLTDASDAQLLASLKRALCVFMGDQFLREFRTTRQFDEWTAASLLTNLTERTGAEWMALVLNDRLGSKAFLGFLRTVARGREDLTSRQKLARDLTLWWERIGECEQGESLREIASKMIAWAGYDGLLRDQLDRATDAQLATSLKRALSVLMADQFLNEFRGNGRHLEEWTSASRLADQADSEQLALELVQCDVQTNPDWMARVLDDQLGAQAFLAFLRDVSRCPANSSPTSRQKLAMDLLLWWEQITEHERCLEQRTLDDTSLRELASNIISWAGYDGSLQRQVRTATAAQLVASLKRALCVFMSEQFLNEFLGKPRQLEEWMSASRHASQHESAELAIALSQAIPAPQTTAESMVRILGDRLGSAAFLDFLGQVAEAPGVEEPRQKLAMDLLVWWEQLTECERAASDGAQQSLRQLAAEMMAWVGYDGVLEDQLQRATESKLLTSLKRGLFVVMADFLADFKAGSRQIDEWMAASRLKAIFRDEAGQAAFLRFLENYEGSSDDDRRSVARNAHRWWKRIVAYEQSPSSSIQQLVEEISAWQATTDCFVFTSQVRLDAPWRSQSLLDGLRRGVVALMIDFLAEFWHGPAWLEWLDVIRHERLGDWLFIPNQALIRSKALNFVKDASSLSMRGLLAALSTLRDESAREYTNLANRLRGFAACCVQRLGRGYLARHPSLLSVGAQAPTAARSLASPAPAPIFALASSGLSEGPLVSEPCPVAEAVPEAQPPKEKPATPEDRAIARIQGTFRVWLARRRVSTFRTNMFAAKQMTPSESAAVVEEHFAKLRERRRRERRIQIAEESRKIQRQRSIGRHRLGRQRITSPSPEHRPKLAGIKVDPESGRPVILNSTLWCDDFNSSVAPQLDPLPPSNASVPPDPAVPWATPVVTAEPVLALQSRERITLRGGKLMPSSFENQLTERRPRAARLVKISRGCHSAMASTLVEHDVDEKQRDIELLSQKQPDAVHRLARYHDRMRKRSHRTCTRVRHDHQVALVLQLRDAGMLR